MIKMPKVKTDIRKFVSPCPYCGGTNKAVVRKIDGGEEWLVHKEAALSAARLLKSFCETQHWTCRKCPFYRKREGLCELHGFPHRWREENWEEGGA